MARAKKVRSANIDPLIGKQLRRFRMDVGVTQTELAQKLGVSYQQVQKYETGGNRISSGTLKTISTTLGIDINAFFPAENTEGKVPRLLTSEQHEIVDMMSALNPAKMEALRQLVRAM